MQISSRSQKSCRNHIQDHLVKDPVANHALEATFNTFKQQLSQYQESPERMKAHFGLIQTLKNDQQKIHDNISHCLFCIYNQQDITHYFTEMMEITDLMRAHYRSYLAIANEGNQEESL